MNVFTWNYRGYGKSTGSPSPNVLRSDIEQIVKFLRAKLELSGKIGVYGRSLGGIPTSHISNLVDMTIVDRSFSTFNDMAYFKY